MLIEKFVGVMYLLTPVEVEGADQPLYGLDTMSSTPLDSYQQALDFIDANSDVDGFQYGQVDKVHTTEKALASLRDYSKVEL